MHDLDKIEYTLARKHLNATAFERCAQDLLTVVYPALSPIPGGTDWGRDADIAGADDTAAARLLATSSRTLEGVRKNLLRGIKSLNDHRVAAQRLVLANPAILSLTDRQKLVESARKVGVRLDVSDIFDGGYFASRLRRDGFWRKKLLDLPSGPITLAPVAPDLAESPWSFLPLVARQDDILAVQGSDDLIVTGPPGVGKSRLAGEFENVAFVDKDADVEQICSDLRWTPPAVVVVDDAVDHKVLIRRLLSLRKTEPDLFTFRLVLACWPDGVPQLQSVLPAARVHTVELIERTPMDELLQQMGVSGQLARGEILNQAEGRPGWAVVLADLLLRSRDAESLLRGKALFGQVDLYLRRAGVDPDAIDILALVAALGEVCEHELHRLATEADVRRSAVATVLGSAARSGLIDIRERYSSAEDRAVRYYAVRPPMLAHVLVAERAFDTPAPMVDFDSLGERWPERLGQLARAAIEAALLGSQTARGRAQHLMELVLVSEDIPHATTVDLSARFMRLDRTAADRILQAARASFAAVEAGDADGRAIEPIAKLAALAVRWYQDEAAMQLLLNACLIDTRPTHLNAGHPLRQIQDLVTNFHPELDRQDELRYALASALQRWLEAVPADVARRCVAAAVMRALLALQLRSAHTDPGRPNTVQLIETVLSPEEMRRVFVDLWPIASRMLDRGNPELADEVLAVVAEWLRIGGDFDRPFGHKHHADCVAAAREIGEALAAALAERSDLGLGLRVNLRSTVEDHGLSVTVDMPNYLEPFFREIERRDADWRQAHETLVADLRQIGRAWSAEDPAVVVGWLAELRPETAKANLLWPGRVWIVFAALAEHVPDPMPWLVACEAAGLMPDGCAFVERALRDGQLTEQRARELLLAPTTRRHVLSLLLTWPDVPPWALDCAVAAVTIDDFRLLETAVLREELTAQHLTALLTRPTAPVRAMVALAVLLGGLHNDDAWTPADLERAWLKALQGLEPANLPGVPGHDVARLFCHLAVRYPQVLANLVERTLAEPSNGGAYAALPHDAWEVLDRLPAAQKSALWRRFKDQAWARHLLLGRMAGTDVDWVRELLDAGELIPEEALAYCFRGIGPIPPTEALAKLLVPRGVDPDQIAGLRFSGTWWGEDSVRYQSILDSFQQMLASHTDASVRAVAQAGIRIFTGARDEAAAKERQQRIRGHR